MSRCFIYGIVVVISSNTISWALNCPSNTPETIVQAIIHDDGTYVPPSITTYVSGVGQLLGIGEISAITKRTAEYHYKICCGNPSAPKDYRKKMTQFSFSTTIGTSAGVGLSDALARISTAADTIGVPSYWLERISAYLSGFSATLAGVNCTYCILYGTIIAI